MKSENLDPLDIRLDPENPRLPPEKHGKDQRELLALLFSEYRVEELATAIAVTGYLQLDPLIGYRRDGAVYIREGNRRIAALQALRAPDALPTSVPTPVRERMIELSRGLDDTTRSQIRNVEVIVYDEVNDVRLETYLGFRHVTGQLPWDPEQRADFIADLIDRHHWSFHQIAARIASYGRHVERQYVAYRVIQQAREQEVDGADGMKIGVLTRALQAKGVIDFLGIEYSGDPTRQREPIPADKLERLREFTAWVFGTASRPAVLRDSRQLTSLAACLSNEDSLTYLRTSESPDLEIAFRFTRDEPGSLVRYFTTATIALEQAAGLVSDHAANAAVTLAAERCVRKLLVVVRDIPTITTEITQWAERHQLPKRTSPRSAKSARGRARG